MTISNGVTNQSSGSIPAGYNNDPDDVASIGLANVNWKNIRAANANKPSIQRNISGRVSKKSIGSQDHAKLRTVQYGKARASLPTAKNDQRKPHDLTQLKQKIEAGKQAFQNAAKKSNDELNDPSLSKLHYQVALDLSKLNSKIYQNPEKYYFNPQKRGEAEKVFSAKGNDDVTKIKKYQIALHMTGFGNFLANFGDKKDGVDGVAGPFTRLALNEYRKSKGLNDLDEAKAYLLKDAESRMSTQASKPTIANSTSVPASNSPQTSDTPVRTSDGGTKSNTEETVSKRERDLSTRQKMKNYEKLQLEIEAASNSGNFEIIPSLQKEVKQVVNSFAESELETVRELLGAKRGSSVSLAALKDELIRGVNGLVEASLEKNIDLDFHDDPLVKIALDSSKAKENHHS